MRKLFNDIRVLPVFAALAMLIFGLPNAVAQDDVPPPLNPYDSPWGSPVPDPSVPSQPGGNSPPVPSSAPPSFDELMGDDSESDFGGSFGGGGGSNQREGKSSFMLVEPSSVDACQLWGSYLLGESRVYKDFNDCQFALERQIEQSKASIEKNIDKVERYKLKKVIRGDLDRKQSKEFELDFSSIRSRLTQASKEGCKCVQQ